MNKIKEMIKHIRTDKGVRKKIFMVTVLCALVFAILIVKSQSTEDKYIADKKGKIIGIHRDDTSKPSSFAFKLRAENDKEAVKKELTVSPRITDGNKGKDAAKSSVSSTDAEIDHIVSTAENSKEKNIMLPGKLPNGSRLTWEKDAQEGGEDCIFIIAVYILLIFLIIRDSMRGSNEEDDARRDIIRKLPRFTNQLMLIMNAGMIQNDAISRICIGYDTVAEEDLGFFERSLIELMKKENTRRLGMAALFTDFACEHNVKELMRIATIMTENERRGSDILENLERESQYLWDTRKTIAKEKGKMIDTKMACPMALLLVLLIIITMAPAMLAM